MKESLLSCGYRKIYDNEDKVKRDLLRRESTISLYSDVKYFKLGNS